MKGAGVGGKGVNKGVVEVNSVRGCKTCDVFFKHKTDKQRETTVGCCVVCCVVFVWCLFVLGLLLRCVCVLMYAGWFG